MGTVPFSHLQLLPYKKKELRKRNRPFFSLSDSPEIESKA